MRFQEFRLPVPTALRVLRTRSVHVPRGLSSQQRTVINVQAMPTDV